MVRVGYVKIKPLKFHGEFSKFNLRFVLKIKTWTRNTRKSGRTRKDKPKLNIHIEVWGRGWTSNCLIVLKILKPEDYNLTATQNFPIAIKNTSCRFYYKNKIRVLETLKTHFKIY